MVTALMGSVDDIDSINGERTNSACKLNSKNITQSNGFDNIIMFIVDEVSLMKKVDLENLNDNLNILCGVSNSSFIFGDVQTFFFSGYFSQLKLVRGKLLFVYIHFFFSLSLFG